MRFQFVFFTNTTLSMDTSYDYFFALQLQRELMDMIDDDDYHDSDVADLTESNSADVIDLTYETDVRKRKLSDKSSNQSYRQNSKVAKSIVDPSLDTSDPNPDIHNLFLTFNRQYFWGTLDSVVVRWSKRMTVCAGLCRYDNGFCSISLSEPLLKLRPRKDLVETLLHEMIHAYLFLTNDRNHSDRDGHGPEFCKHMYRINLLAGTKISIYHEFHNEVKLYQQHWWRCDGPCQFNSPFYGYVKRSMNRAPGPNDKWWANHRDICNGSFVKIKEPERYGLKKKSAATRIPKKLDKPVNKITNFFEVIDSPLRNISGNCSKTISKPEESEQVQQDSVSETMPCPVCHDPVFTEWLNYHLQNCNQLKEMFGDDTSDNKCRCPACNESVERNLMKEHLDSCKMLINVFESDFEIVPDKINYVNCPTCDKMVVESGINAHLDVCLSIE